MIRPRLESLALALVACLALVAGCPHRSALRGQRPEDRLPAVQWSIQLEGDPWPWGVVGDDLLVWTYRFSEGGFLYPIKLESYMAASGRANWSVPIRPWLWSTEVPWSYNVTLTPGTINAWVKGNVARSLSLTTGKELWSVPQCNGLVTAGEHLVSASEQTLSIVDARTGRTLRTVALKAPLVAPPVMAKSKLVGLQEGGWLVGVDPSRGKVAWRVSVGDHAQPDRPVPAGDLVLLSYLPTESSAADRAPEQATLEARRATTGAVVWRKSFQRSATGVQASPLGSLRVAGDLLLLTQKSQQCLVALELASGRQRFRRCGLHLSTPPVRHGARIFVLGNDKRSREALGRGDPWHAVDFPLLSLDARTGQSRPVIPATDSRRKRPRPLRAVRLQIRSIRDDVLYLLQRHRFLTALRIRPATGPSRK